ncbi:MAG: flippase-like domain-containing protein [Elusimicrobia bacterium]|nr:flippase-like domain-containing protein [Elusimicrobiota bacterium]
MTQKVKDLLSFALRAIISGGLLWWIFSMVNWPDTIAALREADLKLIVAAFVIHALIHLVLLWRWQLFMDALSFRAPFGQVCRYFFIGLFCNLFLPTSIGGDLIKAYGLARNAGQKPKVYASVVLDRLSGFGGLVVVALVGYVLGSTIIDAPSVIVPIALLTGLSLVVGFMLFHEPTYTFFCGIFRPFPRLHKALMDMHMDVVLMKGRKRTALGCLLVSCVTQAVAGYMYYLIAVALHQEAHLLHFMIFAPIVCAVSFLPSIGGLGFREFGWAYLLDKVGVSQGIAVGLSLIGFLFVIIVGVFGGILYVTTISHRRVQCDPSKDISGEGDPRG